ncbi:MAG: hypothetical protein AB1768_01455 [Pseudomonadota bacterium]|jgi:hypothetical protein
MADVRPALRFPLLLLGFLSLAAGVGAGLVRLGWNVPLPAPELTLLHGPLMVGGFFGTVIGLERAVALARRWAYLGPLASGLGAAAAVAGAGTPATALPIFFGSLVLLAASLTVFARQRALFTFCLAAGAACWSAGNLLWLLGLPLPGLVPWWMGFLVLTIAGERLELARFLPPSSTAVRLFGVILAAVLVGIVLSLPLPRPGTLLLGFVFAMVFGHAPIIFPAVLRLAVPYNPGFYLPLALLHASVLARVAGDLLGWLDWRGGAGVLNGIALLAFVASTAAAVVRGRRGAQRSA